MYFTTYYVVGCGIFINNTTAIGYKIKIRSLSLAGFKIYDVFLYLICWYIFINCVSNARNYKQGRPFMDEERLYKHAVRPQCEGYRTDLI